MRKKTRYGFMIFKKKGEKNTKTFIYGGGASNKFIYKIPGSSFTYFVITESKIVKYLWVFR